MADFRTIKVILGRADSIEICGAPLRPRIPTRPMTQKTQPMKKLVGEEGKSETQETSSLFKFRIQIKDLEYIDIRHK